MLQVTDEKQAIRIAFRILVLCSPRSVGDVRGAPAPLRHQNSKETPLVCVIEHGDMFITSSTYIRVILIHLLSRLSTLIAYWAIKSGLHSIFISRERKIMASAKKTMNVLSQIVLGLFIMGIGILVLYWTQSPSVQDRWHDVSTTFMMFFCGVFFLFVGWRLVTKSLDK